MHVWIVLRLKWIAREIWQQQPNDMQCAPFDTAFSNVQRRNYKGKSTRNAHFHLFIRIFPIPLTGCLFRNRKCDRNHQPDDRQCVYSP